VIDSITRMLSDVMRIPNPENGQPWDIAVKGNILEVYHTQKRARLGSSPDNLCVLGAGMIAEAIELAASAEQLIAKCTFLLEDRNDQKPWLYVELEKFSCNADSLAAGLTLRHSDRRRYAGGSLSDPVFLEIKEQSNKLQGTQLYLSDQYPDEFMRQIDLADELLFLCPDIRHDFVRWARFTDKAIAKTRDGMSWRSFLRNRERWFHYLQSRLWWFGVYFDWFPTWLLALEERIFDDSGRPSPANYSDGAGIGCITTASDSLDDLVVAGRLTLRIWLQLNLQGYGFQAMTNLTCIAYPQRLGRWSHPTELVPELSGAYGILQNMFDFSETELPIFCFRTGLPIEPYPENARSLRRDDRIHFDEIQQRT